jgi:hypothetical protein
VSWRSRTRRTARAARERAQRVVSRSAGQARLAGRKLARKVVGIQLAAGLASSKRGIFIRTSPADLMRQSAESVVLPEDDGAWRDGYREVAGKFVPSLRPRTWTEPCLNAPENREAGQ